MIKKLKLVKSFCFFIIAMISATFLSCVDDNDDTQAPYLEVSPTTLTFGTDGLPIPESQSSFNISTNRAWTATIEAGKTWVTLSQTQGEESAKIQVSIPQGINDEASILIQISNKVGILMSQTVVIKSGSVSPDVTIFTETTGSQAVSSPYPLVGAYTDWGVSGEGSSDVTFTGVNTSVRASGLANTDAYPGASGPNIIFFGTAPSSLTVHKIALAPTQTNLQLTFGASYSFKNDDGSFDNIFNPANFIVELSGDGNLWTPVTYTKNNGDEASPYWILATADFSLVGSSANLYIRFTSSVSSAIRLDDITLATGDGGQSINLANGTPDNPGGGDNPGDNPGTPTNPFTMTSANIADSQTGTNELPTNSYGSQSVTDVSTWYTWRYNAINFTGVKMCIATAANGGGIQLQGNATNVNNQGRIANVTALSSIQQIVVTMRVVSTSTFAPAYTLYAGSQANPSDTAITPTVVESVDGGFNKYVETYDLSGGTYSYFNIINNKAGALYIDSIEILTQ